MSSAPLPSSPIADESPLAASLPLPPRRPFLQQRWVETALPLVTSLAVHAAIIVLGFAFLQATAAVLRPATQEQVIIPDSTLAEAGPAGGIPNPGLGEDPNRASAQDRIEVQGDAGGWAQNPNQTITRSLIGEMDAGESRLNIGPDLSLGRAAPGAAGGDGGQLAPFGIPGGGDGLGPRVSFIGVGGNAKRIVYLVDASGSMTDAVDRLKAALITSIDKLAVTQQFNVVVFRDKDVLVFNKGRLINATTDNKRRAFDWVMREYYVSGMTDPMPAIRTSFSLQPELIYVLTDGFDQIASFDELKDEFRKQNAGSKVKINTLLIRSRNEPELERVMKEIADQHGGVFKAVERNNF